ncbi:PREDICTED: LOW QUALITY PROTEIN: potential E3 ubiquitin-protein ligase ariadne-2-like [Camelina sativa]|uniref:RBR-type E3 ubiquitin transferase n=1 Tax=Camelina sativa TaxID=90675 RepID=A0ABM0TQD2_CAMSA|nr:PREDICTED: LOW QUALITY PROTEIN: potential E3 ubiquitin-protein ligase ariadne-2-like [Camelina sativa]
MVNPPPPPRILGESSSFTAIHTYRLHSKGLVSQELIKDDTMLVFGLGLSLCNSNDDTKLEISKARRNQKLAQKLARPEAAELAALIHGLEWALQLSVESIQFFCDEDSIILAYVTRKATPNESTVSELLERVFLLQTRFKSCQALDASRDINSSVFKLAKDAIASQTRWCEGDTEYETCPVCYSYVSPNDKFEVRGCFHRICVTCMRNPFSSEQILRGNTAICPYPDCENDLVPEDCRGFADANAITIMIQRKKEKSIPVKDRVYCPNPSCSFLMSDLDLIKHVRNNNPRQSEARKCMECGLSFCKKCHVPWHNNKTCDEFKKSESYLKSDAALFMSFVKTQGLKKCPQCQFTIEHGGGCKQMTCSHCSHEFCYTCGAACKKNKKLTCECSRSGK